MTARQGALRLAASLLPAPLGLALLWLIAGRPALALDGVNLLLALASGCAAVALLLHEALAQGLARGPGRRAAAIEPFAQRLASGQFDQLLVPPPALWRDHELLRLRAALREVHEERQRMRRLLSVLRAAETEPERRRAIDALRRAVDGDDRFAVDAPAPLRSPPADVVAPAMPLLGAAGGALLVGLCAWWWPDGWGALAAAALCAGVAAKLATGRRREPSFARALLAGALAALAWALAAGGVV